VSHDSFGPFQDHPYENHDDLPPSYDASAKLASSPSAESGDERLARQVSTTDREAKSVRGSCGLMLGLRFWLFVSELHNRVVGSQNIPLFSNLLL